MKEKIYLDTSIPSAYFDSSKPLRQLITQKWFEHEAEKYILITSLLAIAEIDDFENVYKKELIKNLLFEKKIEIVEITDKARFLAETYIKKGAIPASEPEDALHIAICVVSNIPYLASWNFKHIVSINPIKKIHEINKSMKLNNIEIGSLELFGGYKYGNL